MVEFENPFARTLADIPKAVYSQVWGKTKAGKLGLLPQKLGFLPPTVSFMLDWHHRGDQRLDSATQGGERAISCS